jgi:hypothetical protein
MTIDAPLEMRPAAVPSAQSTALLTSPILPTLLQLALPNAIAMVGTTLVAVGRDSPISAGSAPEPLAGIALVFPFVMLTQMMSAGWRWPAGFRRPIQPGDTARGNRRTRARRLALHAAMIGALPPGIFFTPR